MFFSRSTKTLDFQNFSKSRVLFTKKKRKKGNGAVEKGKEGKKKIKPTCRQQGGSLHFDLVIMMFSICFDKILLF